MENISAEYSQPVIHAANQTGHSLRLTSSELAGLWASWLESSLKACIVKYFLKTVEDPEIRPVLEYTLVIAEKHLIRLSQIYAGEKHPIPRGFTDEDINLNAPRLFSDSFILYFLEDMARTRLDGYSSAMQMTTRTDVRKFFSECVADPVEIYNRTVSVMLSKGIYLRPPFIPVPEKINFVKKQNFLNVYLRKPRPLNSIELSHVFSGLQRNSLREAIFTGFGQVAGSEQVRRYMAKGAEISSKHAKIFSSLLVENDLPVSMAWDSGIMDSKIAPFPDYLMMNNVMASNVVLFGSYGKALPVVGLKKDLAVDFARLSMEILKFAKEGVNIMIGSGWLEEPPPAKKP